jgi:Right handed beta helix region
MKCRTTFAAVGLMLAAVFFAASATAQTTRTFVSPTGNDSNPCNLAAPCRTFQAAYNQTIAGGEITVLGSAGFGTMVIDKAISIVNPGGYLASMFASPGGTGIVINAGPNDAVSLRGLTINGGDTGYNGIVFNSGASLTIDNCVVQDFHFGGPFSTGHGIVIAPTSGTMTYFITNTTVANNGKGGISFLPPNGSSNATGVIDHVKAIRNGYGLLFDTSRTTSSGSVSATISDSLASNNTAYGIFAFNGSGVGFLTVNIDNVRVSGNPTGISAQSNSQVLLGRSTIVANSTGIDVSASSLYTYQNNQVNENYVDINGTVTPLTFH